MLSPSQRRTVQALADTLLPSIADGDPQGGDVVPDALADFLAHLDPSKRRALGIVLTVFDLAAIPLHGRRFSRLAPGARERYLQGWMTSRLAPRRAIYRSLKALCGFLYFQDERSWPLVGYDGPVVKRDKREAA
jgi:hypothetical protein